MPTVVNLLPTGEAAWGITGGAYFGGTSDWQNLKDAADGSGWNGTAAYGTPYALTLDMATTTIPAGAFIAGIRCKGRLYTLSGSTATYLWVVMPNGSGIVSYGPFVGPQSIQDVVGNYVTLNPNGNSIWTQAALDTVQFQLYDGNVGSTVTFIAEASVDVQYYAIPVVSAVAPTGTITTGTPLVTWSFAGDTLTQSWFQVQVLSGATVVSDTGIINSAATSVYMGPLNDGAFTVQVRAAQNVNGNQHWSAYATASITVTRPPNTPSLSSPSSGSQLDLIPGQTFSWVYSHPDAAVLQNGWSFRRKVGAGAYEYWNNFSGAWSTAGRAVADGVTNSTTTLTSATAAFVSADTGRIITGTNIPAGTYIASVTNGTTVLLSQAATGTGSGITITLGIIYWNSGATLSKTFAAGLWSNANTNYNWSVAVQSTNFQQSAFAADWLVIGNAPPSCNVTGPVSPVTTTTKPTITWTYSDPDADVQAAYEAKLFAASQYTYPGFVPTWPSNTYGSGVVASSTTSVTVTSGLTTGTTYRAYVRVQSAGTWSGWSYLEFTVTLLTAAAPVITATADAPNARVLLSATASINLIPDTNSANFDTTVGQWLLGGGCTLAFSSAVAGINSLGSLQITTTNTISFFTSQVVWPTPVPVTAGQSYTYSYWIKSSNGGVRTAFPSIRWFDSTGATISTTNGGTVTVSASYQLSSMTASAPTGAVTAAVIINSVSVGSAGELYHITNVMIVPGTSTTWGRGALAPKSAIRVEYSDDAGVTWAAVRNGARLVFPDYRIQTATMYDYEFVSQKLRSYRAFVISNFSDNLYSDLPLYFTTYQDMANKVVTYAHFLDYYP